MQIKQIIFDADDTLWENNIYYVQASSDFFDLIEESGFDRRKIQQDFDDLELRVVRERGYGSHNFVYILEELFRRYQKLSKSTLDRRRLREIVDRFKHHPSSPPRLFEGVVDTLQYLKPKYGLYVLTKGDFEEQRGKILLAGIDRYVNDFFIMPEKDDRTYCDLLQKHHWKAEETCMVGNSPKSDINPALRCGMYAIHIPYRDTWKLDNEAIQAIDGRFFELKQFTDLKKVL